MKRVLLNFITIMLVVSLNCSKHYQGDLDSFSLQGEWLYQFTESLNFQEVDSMPSGWMEAITPIVFRKSDLKLNKQWIWLKRGFILPGHFVNNPLFLDLGEFRGNTEFYLNGRLLSGLQNMGNIGKMFLMKYRLIELDMADLNFGRQNKLLVEARFGNISDSLYIDQPAIYSRAGFLKKQGFSISECPYRLERDIHATLEDFNLAWLRGDSLQLYNFFDRNFIFRDMNPVTYTKKLIELKTVHNISQIELTGPDFYLLNGQDTVLVFGDWKIRSDEQPFYHLTFILNVVKRDQGWLIGKIY
ncbi:MAG: hypothetical protein P8Y60_01660 [Calditrichota bacterium]